MVDVDGSAIFNDDASGWGWQVATVSISTNFRMKNFGNVPPRFETLYINVR